MRVSGLRVQHEGTGFRGESGPRCTPPQRSLSPRHSPSAATGQGFSFRVLVSGFRVQGCRFRVQILALAFRQTSLQRSRLFPLRSKAGMQPRSPLCGSMNVNVSFSLSLTHPVSIARSLSLVFNQGQAGRHLADEEGATLQLQRVCA